MADPIFKELAYAALEQTARNPTQDFLRATPRNPVLGYLADLAASSYAPQRTQQMQGIAQFFGAPAVSQTLDRLSYGEPLTTGAGGLGGTTRVRPEAIEAAMIAAPFVGKAAKATKGLPVGMSIKDVSPPQAEAMRLAQQRAALPVEQGGLGLGPNNTAAERAAAMGFDIPAYHGTSADIQAIRVGGQGKTSGAGAFFTDNPALASTYSVADGGNVIPVLLKNGKYVEVEGKGANWNWLNDKTKMKAPKTSVPDVEGDALMSELLGVESAPTMINRKEFTKSLGKVFPEEFRWNDAMSTDDIAQWANKQGYEGVNFNAVRDRGPNAIFNTPEASLPSNITAVFNPDQIRSRFAAFDPFRKTAATAATMGVAAPDLLAQEQPSEMQLQAMILRDIGTDLYTIYQQTGVWLGGDE
jgi:hypothetical protein